MTDYRTAQGSPVPHVATKYDGFKLIKTEHPYKHQKGSGRAVCFDLAQDGMTIGDWAKACAAQGFDSKFVVGSIIKLQGAKEPGWLISKADDQGRTLAMIKKIRDADPSILAKREAKKAASDEAKANAKAKRDADLATKAAAKEAKAAETKAKADAEATRKQEVKAAKQAEAQARKDAEPKQEPKQAKAKGKQKQAA